MIKRMLRPFVRKIAAFLNREDNLRRFRASRLYQELVLRNENEVSRMQEEYSALAADSDARNLLKLKERKYYSQNGEDGILLYLFSLVGAGEKTFIEFGIEDGVECNAANLALNFNWRGLFIEGSAALAGRARRFYHGRHGCSPERVRIINAFVTRENVNQLFSEHGPHGELALLSIDVDGNDYWIWDAVTAVKPRIVVIEYNASFGANRSVTVKYEPAFDRYQKHPSGWYHGASVKALAKLGERKGYVLAGCDSHGANAFFVRADIAKGQITPMTPEEAYYPSIPRLREATVEEQFARIAHLELVEV